MFDLPGAKRIRRSDLYTRSESSSPAPSETDPELEAQLQSHFAALYGSPLDFAFKSASISPIPVAGEVAEDEAEQEFEFRLFSAPASKGDGTNAEPQKIILDDIDDETGEGGFVRARDPRVWVVRKVEGEQKQDFESVAVTGEEILRRKNARAWGLEVPWRVKALQVVGNRESQNIAADSAVIATGEEDDVVNRKRPGKKRRFILRQRKKKSEESANRRRKEQEEKDEAEKEKRTRRNREKKVKRKLKEKAKKVNGTEAKGGDVAIALQDKETTSRDSNLSSND